MSHPVCSRVAYMWTQAGAELYAFSVSEFGGLLCIMLHADNAAPSSPLLYCILRLSVYIEILCIMEIALLLTSGGCPKHSKTGGEMVMMCFEATRRYRLSTAHLTQ